MSFIGIITDKKQEQEMSQTVKISLKKCNRNDTIVLINQNSVTNIKNIKFETIIINHNNILQEESLKKILLNANRVILNTDISDNLKLIENIKLTVITYGLNQKSTVTASSIIQDEALICIQRSIKNIYGNTIEPQEIKIEKYSNIYTTMLECIIDLLYNKIVK